MQSKVVTTIVLFVGLFIALLFGSFVGSEDFESLSIYAVAGIAIYFLVNGWKNVWWFTALLLFSGVVFSHGFIFEAYHLFGLMLLIASLIAAMSKHSPPRLQTFSRAKTSLLAVPLWILLAFAAVHFIITYAFPYDASRYSLKTSAKAYVEGFAGMFCLAWLLTSKYTFRVKSNWSSRLICIMVFCLLANAAVSGYMFASGYQAADGLGAATDLNLHFLYVPVINMQAGIYTLRDICPQIAAILFCIITIPGWWRSQSNFIRAVVILGIFSLFIGSIFSGGRFVPMFTVGLIGLVFIYRKMFTPIIIAGVLALVAFAAINLGADWINRNMPTYVARSVQMVMIDKGAAATTIENSSSGRKGAIEAAIEDWQTDNRRFFFGRSAFAITWDEADYLKKRYGEEGFVMTAVISGRSHNLVTDLLLQYGLVGAILYLVCYVFVIAYFFRLHKAIPSDASMSKALAAAMMLFLPFIFVYQLVGGQYLPISAALCAGLIRADLIMRKNRLTETAPSPVTAPQGVRVQRPMLQQPV